MHTKRQIRNAVAGLPIGEEDYDASRHDATSILPMSLGEEVTGMPQVGRVLPNKPNAINLVADYRAAGLHPELRTRRDALISAVTSQIYGSKPGLDKMNVWTIGQPPLRTAAFEGQAIGGNEPYKTARDVAELSINGLTIVVSSLRGLPFAEVGERLDGLVAVKANLGIERQIPSSVGVIALGKVDIDTSKTDQVNRANEILDQTHLNIVRPLEEMGVNVAEAVYDPSYSYGLNADAVDTSVAEAINAYAKGKHQNNIDNYHNQ